MVGQWVNGTSCLILSSRRAKPQGYTPGFVFQRLSLPPAVQEPEGPVLETGMTPALQLSGWYILKVPVP